MNYPPITVKEAYLQASSFLQREKVQDAAICTELLLQHLLHWDRTTFLSRWSDETMPTERLQEWQAMLERKAAGEPVQYIIGTQEFYGLTFIVTPAVLIPRPETEILVEQIVRYGKQLWPKGNPTLADIGTGSGAIAVTIAAQCPDWTLMSSDISEAAVEVARSNAARNGVSTRIHFLTGDLLQPFIRRGMKPDILVSNPPYIATQELYQLQPEVRSFEPWTALDGGEDGLDFYRRIIAQMSELPAFPSLVGFEVGKGQTGEVAMLLRQAHDWEQVEVFADLAGINRHVIAYRGESSK